MDMASRYDHPEYQKQLALQMLATPTHDIACKALVDLREEHAHYKTWSKTIEWYDQNPDEGDLMTLRYFWDRVLDGAFIDDDGHGVYATATKKSRVLVYPSEVPTWENSENKGFMEWDVESLCPGATHVMWYNK